MKLNNEIKEIYKNVYIKKKIWKVEGNFLNYDGSVRNVVVSLRGIYWNKLWTYIPIPETDSRPMRSEHLRRSH